MNCRTGCKTQNHSSWAECARASNVTVSATINSPLQRMYEATKKDLPAYRTARAHGIQPGGTSLEKVRHAEQATKLLGRPYNAEKDPPANLIVNKNTARFTNVMGD
jgi:hypothetical protein